MVRRPMFVALVAIALAVPACGGGGCPPVLSTTPDDSSTVSYTPVDTPTDSPTDQPTDEPTDGPTDGSEAKRRLIATGCVARAARVSLARLPACSGARRTGVSSP